jgi:hypothetical protein
MSLTLAIAFIVLADIALLAGLSYVMSRAKLLTPHVPGNAPIAAQPSARHTRRVAPAHSGQRTQRARSASVISAEA